MPPDRLRSSLSCRSWSPFPVAVAWLASPRSFVVAVQKVRTPLLQPLPNQNPDSWLVWWKVSIMSLIPYFGQIFIYSYSEISGADNWKSLPFFVLKFFSWLVVLFVLGGILFRYVYSVLRHIFCAVICFFFNLRK